MSYTVPLVGLDCATGEVRRYQNRVPGTGQPKLTHYADALNPSEVWSAAAIMEGFRTNPPLALAVDGYSRPRRW